MWAFFVHKMTAQTHIPKGSMCAVCTRPSLKCAQLPFETMTVIKVYPDGTKAVRCTGFAQGPQKAVAALEHIPPTVQWLAPDDTEGGAT